jgi:hypothetical protein
VTSVVPQTLTLRSKQQSLDVPACLSRFTDVQYAVSGRGNNPITIRPIPRPNHDETGYETRTAISAASLNAKSQSCRKRGKP